MNRAAQIFTMFALTQTMFSCHSHTYEGNMKDGETLASTLSQGVILNDVQVNDSAMTLIGDYYKNCGKYENTVASLFNDNPSTKDTTVLKLDKNGGIGFLPIASQNKKPIDGKPQIDAWMLTNLDKSGSIVVSANGLDSTEKSAFTSKLSNHQRWSLVQK